MKLLVTFILLHLNMISQDSVPKSLTKNNMTVEWKFVNDHIEFRMLAPTTGWVAIGFNTTPELTGTNLFMGAVANDKVRVDDRYILNPGNHKSIKELGGLEAVTHINGAESDDKTIIQFSLPAQAVDQYHINLEKGQSIHLLMAYSREDDFSHHSIMRTTTKIIL